MTRKDYELIATAIKATRDEKPNRDDLFWRGHHSARVAIAQELADSLDEDNPLFDRNRFLAACGLS